MGDKWVKSLKLFVFLLALWLLMSGLFTTLLVGFGIVSSVGVVLVAHRLQLFSKKGENPGLNPVGLMNYLFWLVAQVIKADLAVLKVVYSANMGLRQRLIQVPCSQSTELGKVVFANSITLTPGTITVETEDDHFLVHALTDNAVDYAGFREMDAKISAIENAGGA